MLLLNLFKDLVTGEAYRPSATAKSAPIGGANSRFFGRRAVGFAFGSDYVRAVAIEFDKAGEAKISDVTYAEIPKDRGEVRGFLSDFAANARSEHALVLIEDRGTPELMNVAVSESDIERNRKLAEDPREVLGHAVTNDGTQRYAAVSHPAFPETISFSTPTAYLGDIVSLVESAGLIVTHVQLSPLVIFDFLRNRHFTEILNNRDLLILTGTSSLLIQEDKQHWVQVRHYSDTKWAEVVAYTNTFLKERREKQDAMKPIHLVNTSNYQFTLDEEIEHLVTEDPLAAEKRCKPDYADFFCLVAP